MPPQNHAAYLPAKCARLAVSAAPYTPPGPHEIVIKNAAIAVNPVEWSKQLVGDLMFNWIKYPFVLGNDCAGTVTEVGSAVTRFTVGDRVLAHALSMDPAVNKSAEGAFQEYVVVRANMAARIPDAMSFKDAAVLPLGLSTAACGLFQKDYLALRHPETAPSSSTSSSAASAAAKQPNGGKESGKGQAVLIWGGSTAVGSNAIQLAAAAGYEVITTAGAANHEYVKKLGATVAFDYRHSSCVAEVTAALQGKQVAGAVAIGNGSTEACMDVLAGTRGATKFVAQASFPWPATPPTDRVALVRTMLGLMWWNVSVALRGLLRGVKAKFIFGSSLHANEVGALVYEDFISAALAQGTFVAAPEATVVGAGLESVQGALDTHMKGVSAKKIVITL